jgi:hypothetical protein
MANAFSGPVAVPQLKLTRRNADCSLQFIGEKPGGNAG